MNGVRPPQTPRTTISSPLTAPVVRGSRSASVCRAGAERGVVVAVAMRFAYPQRRAANPLGGRVTGANRGIPEGNPGYGGRVLRPATTAGYDRAMPDRLHFTDSDEANQLIAADPMALLIGFALDQQVSVQKAFSGPLAI